MRVILTDADAHRRWTGEAIDLSTAGIAGGRVRRAITGAADNLTIDAPGPARWWPALGVPSDDTPALNRLVAAARSRGVRVPAERQLAAAEHALANHAVQQVDLNAARERLASAGANVEALREQVATVRGRLTARRETGADTQAAEEALANATARLSEAETERVAAEQAHAAAQQRAREARSAREERLRLQDRVANRRRDVRRALVTEIASEFTAAVDAVPGEATLSQEPLTVEGDPVTAALAAVRVATLRAPIVDTTGRFNSAAAARRRLDSPVIRC